MIQFAIQNRAETANAVLDRHIATIVTGKALRHKHVAVQTPATPNAIALDEDGSLAGNESIKSLVTRSE